MSTSRHSMIGATSDHVLQAVPRWRGSSSGAIVKRSSTPQTSQRYRTFTLRISPAGGGGGSGRVSERSIAMPVFHTTIPMRTPARPTRRSRSWHDVEAIDGYPQGGAGREGAARRGPGGRRRAPGAAAVVVVARGRRRRGGRVGAAARPTVIVIGDPIGAR